MDYILQMEKLLKYLDFSLETNEKIILSGMKQKFNNDLNLLGCFIKDFLTVKNSGKAPCDENLYNDFVLYFENKTDSSKAALEQLNKYSDYYIQITFEEFRKLEKLQCAQLITTVSTVNSCFALDCYPCLIKLIDNYLNQKIDVNLFSLMLKYLSDMVITRFENPENYDGHIKDFWDKIEGKIPFEERLAG